jgi:hypothetical protein
MVSTVLTSSSNNFYFHRVLRKSTCIFNKSRKSKPNLSLVKSRLKALLDYLIIRRGSPQNIENSFC